MRADVCRRLEALESKKVSGIDFILILRRIARPGIVAGEIAVAKVMGQRFERLPAETEDDFIARVRAYAGLHRLPGQMAVSVLCDEIDMAL